MDALGPVGRTRSGARSFAPKLLFVAALNLTVAVCAGASESRAEEARGQAHGQIKEDREEFVPGASVLEGRIRAPCCWNQTLDIHGSEISNAMKREIRARLRAGEAPETIEASFVARYGERILAVPPSSPLKGVAVALSLAMGAAGVFAVVLLRRWSKRSRPAAAPAGTPAAGRDKWDDKLDNELKELDPDAL